MNVTRENDGQNRRGEVAIKAEKDRLLMASLYRRKNIACVARVWRELEGGIEACENAVSASLSCAPYMYSRALISVKTPATKGTQTGKTRQIGNETNAWKQGKRIQFTRSTNTGVSCLHNSLRLLKCKSKHRLQ